MNCLQMTWLYSAFSNPKFEDLGVLGIDLKWEGCYSGPTGDGDVKIDDADITIFQRLRDGTLISHQVHEGQGVFPRYHLRTVGPDGAVIGKVTDARFRDIAPAVRQRMTESLFCAP